MNDTRLVVEEEIRVRRGGPADMSEPWPVSWSGVWVGALAALAVGLVIGLIGLALGATQATPRRLASWSEFRFVTLVFAVAGAFLSFVVGGWAAAKIPGIRRAETAMLHGSIVWLVAVPLLLVMACLGAGAFLGEWYGGLAGTPSWAAPSATAVDAGGDPARAARNAALGALTALLIGLMGSVVGGWLGSGEPMTLRARREVRTGAGQLRSDKLRSNVS